MRALRERDHREHADQIVRYMQTYREPDEDGHLLA